MCVSVCVCVCVRVTLALSIVQCKELVALSYSRSNSRVPNEAATKDVIMMSFNVLSLPVSLSLSLEPVYRYEVRSTLYDLSVSLW